MRSQVGYILRLALTLLVITAVVAAALAGVNAITAPRIAAANAEKTQQAIEAVLPGGGTAVEDFTDPTGLIKAVYASDTGYAVQVTPAGFDGAIDMMVGVSKEGKVLNISIISHTETAGLGAVAAAKTAAGEVFRGQFAQADAPYAVGDNVDALTGATITSKAVTLGVNTAVEFVKSLG